MHLFFRGWKQEQVGFDPAEAGAFGKHQPVGHQGLIHIPQHGRTAGPTIHQHQTGADIALFPGWGEDPDDFVVGAEGADIGGGGAFLDGLQDLGPDTEKQRRGDVLVAEVQGNSGDFRRQWGGGFFVAVAEEAEVSGGEGFAFVGIAVDVGGDGGEAGDGDLGQGGTVAPDAL